MTMTKNPHEEPFVGLTDIVGHSCHFGKELVYFGYKVTYVNLKLNPKPPLSAVRWIRVKSIAGKITSVPSTGQHTQAKSFGPPWFTGV